jgi:hypothetical protein
VRPDEAAVPLATVRDAARAHNAALAGAFEAMCRAGGTDRDAAIEVMQALARQVERERAVFVGTGCTASGRSLDEVLAELL